ncbi:MAG: hypothetical protein KGV46_03560 [Pasteurella sp.]|nr:hypothetical protein [Pasteurella sp.]
MKLRKIFLTTLCLLTISVSQAANFKITKNQMVEEFYKSCMENEKMTKLVDIFEIPQDQFCVCFKNKAGEEFDNKNLEKKFNSKNITMGELISESEKLGETAGGYCAEKFMK